MTLRQVPGHLLHGGVGALTKQGLHQLPLLRPNHRLRPSARRKGGRGTMLASPADPTANRSHTQLQLIRDLLLGQRPTRVQRHRAMAKVKRVRTAHQVSLVET